MTEWSRIGDKYFAYGHRIKAAVWQDGEFWRNNVYVTGDGEVDRGEWLDRESAIRNANSAMSRLCWNRRFEKDCPVLPNNSVDDDDDDDEDDDDDND